MKRVTVVHLSDLHLPVSAKIPWSQMMNKRLLGYANIRAFRGKHMNEAGALSLMRRAASEPADIYVMTGDLSNLALPVEFDRASRLLHNAGFVPEKTLVVPGNHDRYVLQAQTERFFEHALADWLPQGFAENGIYPLKRTVGPILLIGLDTAVARGGTRSAGLIGAEQLGRLEQHLDSPQHAGLWPVIALHHPPLPINGSALRQYSRGLVGFGKLLRLLEGRGATLIHGHLHVQERRRVANLEVIGAPSISRTSRDPRDAMGYHVYTFSPQGLETAHAVRIFSTEEGETIVQHELALPSPPWEPT